MSNLRAVYLAPEEISEIVVPLLQEDFTAYGFRGQIIKEDEAYDGDPIIRVRADVGKPVPVSVQIKTLSRIHDALRAKNEERIVFLSAPGPDSLSKGTDDEVDAG